MVRGKAKKVSRGQKLAGYGILMVLGLITVWLLVQQGRFNPAVTAWQSLGGASAGKAQNGALAGLIPEVPGFTPRGPAQGYGPENLSDKINGKAELYLSAGFQAMACRSFTLENPAGAHLELFVYDMGEAQNAYAVFSSQRRPGAATLSLTANAYATPNALFFTQGKYYVELVADRALENLPEVLKPLTGALLAKLPAEGDTANLGALLPSEGLARDRVRLNAADAFGLEGFDNVYTGEYTTEGGVATAFLAQRPSPAEAAAMAQKFQDFLRANGYQEVPAPKAPAGMTLLALDSSFDVILVKGRVVAGVHDAPSAAAALELAGRLREALKAVP